VKSQKDADDDNEYYRIPEKREDRTFYYKLTFSVDIIN